VPDEARNLLVLHTPWGIEAAAYHEDTMGGGEVARFDADRPGVEGQAETTIGLMGWFKKICPQPDDPDGICPDGWSVRAVVVGIDREGVLYEGDLVGYLQRLQDHLQELLLEIPGARMRLIVIEKGDGDDGAAGQEGASPEA